MRIAREWQPEVVLMDLAMPEMNGVTATGMLRFARQTSELLIIATSTFCRDPEWRKRAFAAGVDECLYRPVELDALERVIAQRFGKPN